ncbi:hypothetical protein M9Y10_037566 [Tritrichomonas musculus]|uniref:Uncharacterized protein n=1 Tax=Tritrichomonas musculus TaxID=1915356 RepID=A0ABR2GSJ2_9EUKA
MQNDIFSLEGEVLKEFDFYEYLGKYNELAYRYEYDYELWEEEGQRFLKEDFIQSYVDTKTPPTLDDEMTEIIEWLRIGLCSSLFFVQWVDYQRSVLGRNFLRMMLNAYKPYEEDLKFVVKSIKYLIAVAEPFSQ